MFSSQLRKTVAIAESVRRAPRVDTAEFISLLQQASVRSLDDEEIVALIGATREAAHRRTLLDFAASYRRPLDREILLLPPLYFSSICENRCRYCNFSRDGERLDLEQFEHEFSFLVALGFRSIELVSSQDPHLYPHAEGFSLEEQRFHVEAMLPYVELASGMLHANGGGMLTTNIPPLDVESLRKLRESGLDCFLVWQETFNPEQYGRLHVARGPKGNQAFRLDSMENSLFAGIPHLAGAFLKGLYDWREEEVALYLFDRYLKRRNGRGFSIIGTPRVKGEIESSPVIAPYRMSDEEYELNIALDRILFDGILWLQTRESFELNLRLLRRYGGGVILTLLSSTAPGGYAAPSSADPQFPVFKQDLDNSVQRLGEADFTVRFAWDEGTLTSFQRPPAQTEVARVG